MENPEGNAYLAGVSIALLGIVLLVATMPSTKQQLVSPFVNHSMMFNATLRQLEIIGEAANHISEDVQMANPEILWARIIALRNLVIHEYFGIDDNSIWSIY